ncbi:TspO/MBR family protein [Flavobacterium procerum]|uniref:TspO/MBR family protein n=1 Tax=Flavobacterium procerum TaxID=1455569 RepID=UPI0035ED9FD4
MAVAAALVWDKIKEHKKKGKKRANCFFFIFPNLGFLNSILVLNLIFWGIEKIPCGFFKNLKSFLLWLMIYETYLKFIKINKISGYLLIPYLAWVGFATVLNASIWVWRNKKKYF